MAGSRSRPVSLVLAAHGDRAGAEPNRALIAQCERLRSGGRFAAVRAGFLKGEPSLEAALAGAVADDGEIVVYPFLMASGYFTGTVLPQRIAAAGLDLRCRIVAPLGLDPALPGLMCDEAISAARAGGHAASRCALLVVGHGSRLARASKEATEAAAGAIRQPGHFRSVTIGLIEEPPFVADALAALEAPMVVIGFLSGDGLHAGEDIPAAIRASGKPAIYAGSVGTLPSLAGIIEAAVLA